MLRAGLAHQGHAVREPQRARRACPTARHKRDAKGKPVLMAMPDSDSGIYLRGQSKAQVNIWCWPVGSGEVYGYRTDDKMPAAVRAGVTPKKQADRNIGEWNTFEITVGGNRLTVVLNGETVIDKRRAAGPARRAAASPCSTTAPRRTASWNSPARAGPVPQHLHQGAQELAAPRAARRRSSGGFRGEREGHRGRIGDRPERSPRDDATAQRAARPNAAGSAHRSTAASSHSRPRPGRSGACTWPSRTPSGSRRIGAAQSTYSIQSAVGVTASRCADTSGNRCVDGGYPRGLGQRRRAQPAGDAADLHGVGHEQVGGAGADRALEVVRAPAVLPDLDRRARRARHLGAALVVVRAHRLLDPLQPLPVERAARGGPLRGRPGSGCSRLISRTAGPTARRTARTTARSSSSVGVAQAHLDRGEPALEKLHRLTRGGLRARSGRGRCCCTRAAAGTRRPAARTSGNPPPAPARPSAAMSMPAMAMPVSPAAPSSRKRCCRPRSTSKGQEGWSFNAAPRPVDQPRHRAQREWRVAEDVAPPATPSAVSRSMSTSGAVDTTPPAVRSGRAMGTFTGRARRPRNGQRRARLTCGEVHRARLSRADRARRSGLEPLRRQRRSRAS